MDVSWFLLLVSAAILISIVLLVVICLDCRNKGPLRSIPQSASEEYIPSGFRVIHPSQPTPPSNPVIITTSPSDPHLRLPFSNSTKPEQRPYTPTETESNPSYENPAPESEADDAAANYIEVLPDNPEENKGIPPDIQSQASTPSSDHNYENIKANSDNEDDDDEDDDHYQNVQPGSTPDLSAQSSDDEYEDSNYVNQSMGILNNL